MEKIVSDISYFMVAATATIVIFLLQYTSIGSRQEAFDAQRPSTFFPLRYFVSTTALRLISFVAALPVSLLFGVVCLRSKDAVIGIVKEFSPRVINSFIPIDYHSAVVTVFNEHFDSFSYVSPLFLLLAGLFFFSPYVNIPIVGFQNLIIRSTGILQKVDEYAGKYARNTIDIFGGDYEKTRKILEDKFHFNLPLRDELSRSDSILKTAYGLIYCAKENTYLGGIAFGLEETFSSIKGVRNSHTAPNRNIKYLDAALPLPAFLALCAFFTLASSYENSNGVVVSSRWSPYLLEWVHDPMQSATQIIRYIFCYIVPLFVGIFVFVSRRSDDESLETIGDCVRPAGLVQFVISVPIAFVYCFLDSIQIIGGVQSSATATGRIYSVVTTKFWFDVVTISAMAPISFLLWICCRYYLHFRGRLLVFFLVLFSGLIPGLQALGYEAYSGSWRGLYWFWSVLGLWISLSLVLTAQSWNRMIANRVLW